MHALPGAFGRLRHGIALLVCVASLSGCGFISIWGDSQTANGAANITSQYSDVNATLDIHGRPGCGFYGNPLCPTPNWGVPIGAALASYAAANQSVRCFVVHLGLNDALWNLDLATRNYAAKIDTFMKWFPSTTTVVWLNLPYAQAPTLPGLDARLQFVNAQLVKAEQRFSNLSVWDLRAHFNGHFPEWYLSDGFHYNATGSLEFAAQMRAATDAAGCS